MFVLGALLNMLFGAMDDAFDAAAGWFRRPASPETIAAPAAEKE